MSFQDVCCVFPSMYGVLGVDEVFFQAGKHDKTQHFMNTDNIPPTPQPPPPPEVVRLVHPKNITAIPKKTSSDDEAVSSWCVRLATRWLQKWLSCSSGRCFHLVGACQLALTLWPNKQQSWTGTWSRSPAGRSWVHYMKLMESWTQ